MKTILCYGDSNTFGYEPVSCERLPYPSRWPGVLASALGDGYHVVEEGLPGRTTVFEDPITEGLNGLMLITPLMMTHMPLDTMIIMLGTNDTKQRFCVQAGMIAKGMARLLEKALATPAWRGKPDILLVSPAPILPCYALQDKLDGFGDGADHKSAGLSSAYAQISEQLGLRFFNAGTIVQPHESDGVHLSPAAHITLGQQLATFF